MIVHDGLYGQFDLPDYLRPIIMAPEVRRLSQIRLINTLSPALTTLSDLRRFGHTLGAAHLASLVDLSSFSVAEQKAFRTAVVLHDIGTAPFGHSFEYLLHEAGGWSHESVVRDLVWARHTPENLAHQIFGGRLVELRRALRLSGVSTDLLELLFTGQHPLSPLLAGSLDLDNLDNVCRMGWALGFRVDPLFATAVAKHLRPREDGIFLGVAEGRGLMKTWLDLRAQVYEVLLFDPTHTAAQAVLFEALRLGCDDGSLTQEDWWLTDEDVLSKLRGRSVTRGLISGMLLGRLPGRLLCLQLRGSLGDYGPPNRLELLSRVRKSIGVLGLGPLISFVAVDSRTLSRTVSFGDPVSGQSWSLGEDSASVLVYLFSRNASTLSLRDNRRLEHCLRETLAFRTDQVLRLEIGEERGNASQGSISFEA